MKLTLLNRLRLCFEIMTIRSGHKHTAYEKQLSIFQRGYAAGRYDEELEMLEKWREARIKFIAGNPHGDEHVASEHCWCEPEVSYTDPEDGATVYVHRRIQ